MGKIITFQSPLHGQCKTTATCIAGAMMAENCVITHIQTRMSSMEEVFGFGDQVAAGALDDTGMNNLIYTMSARLIKEADINAAVFKITPELDMLPALGQTSNDAEKDVFIKQLITVELPKYYKYVFVDLGTEKRKLSKEIQAVADINYIVLNQNKALWNTVDDVPNARYILAGYNENSKYTTASFAFNHSTKVSTLPYCQEYADAISDKAIPKFFAKNQNIKKGKNNPLANFFIDAKGILK